MEAWPGSIEIDALGSLGSTERQQRSRGGGAVTESTGSIGCPEKRAGSDGSSCWRRVADWSGQKRSVI
ncbi:hypothetical protein M0R45_006754 [Rubus argutus]|uniref:Uncharacterized protein n=1 Tax=Rubus argutus TaxID=59490 RepID=A0AAW1YRF6_RUBAR